MIGQLVDPAFNTLSFTLSELMTAVIAKLYKAFPPGAPDNPKIVRASRRPHELSTAPDGWPPRSRTSPEATCMDSVDRRVAVHARELFGCCIRSHAAVRSVRSGGGSVGGN